MEGGVYINTARTSCGVDPRSAQLVTLTNAVSLQQLTAVCVKVKISSTISHHCVRAGANSNEDEMEEVEEAGLVTRVS